MSGKSRFCFAERFSRKHPLRNTGRRSGADGRAAKAAFAHEFIARFPLGYDTPVGEFGWQLSMGERQRVALARAIIKDAPIVLLDEPTASLDSESEKKVQESLHRLCAGRSVVLTGTKAMQRFLAFLGLAVKRGGRLIQQAIGASLMIARARATRWRSPIDEPPAEFTNRPVACPSGKRAMNSYANAAFGRHNHLRLSGVRHAAKGGYRENRSAKQTGFCRT